MPTTLEKHSLALETVKSVNNDSFDIKSFNSNFDISFSKIG